MALNNRSAEFSTTVLGKDSDFNGDVTFYGSILIVKNEDEQAALKTGQLNFHEEKEIDYSTDIPPDMRSD